MIIAIVVLILSLIAMAAMVVAKRHEMKVGRLVLAANARMQIEKKVKEGANVARDVANVAVNKHFWKGLSAFLWKEFRDKVWKNQRVQKITKKAADVVRGKKEIKSTGPVSFYLKDVSEFKDQVKMK